MNSRIDRNAAWPTPFILLAAVSAWPNISFDIKYLFDTSSNQSSTFAVECSLFEWLTNLRPCLAVGRPRSVFLYNITAGKHQSPRRRVYKDV